MLNLALSLSSYMIQPAFGFVLAFLEAKPKTNTYLKVVLGFRCNRSHHQGA